MVRSDFMIMNDVIFSPQKVFGVKRDKEFEVPRIISGLLLHIVLGSISLWRTRLGNSIIFRQILHHTSDDFLLCTNLWDASFMFILEVKLDHVGSNKGSLMDEKSHVPLNQRIIKKCFVCAMDDMHFLSIGRIHNQRSIIDFINRTIRTIWFVQTVSRVVSSFGERNMT